MKEKLLRSLMIAIRFAHGKPKGVRVIGDEQEDTVFELLDELPQESQPIKLLGEETIPDDIQIDIFGPDTITNDLFGSSDDIGSDDSPDSGGFLFPSSPQKPLAG